MQCGKEIDRTDIADSSPMTTPYGQLIPLTDPFPYDHGCGYDIYMCVQQ